MRKLLILMSVMVLGIFMFQPTQTALATESSEGLEMYDTGEKEITLINNTRDAVIVKIYYKGSLETTIVVPPDRSKRTYHLSGRTCRYFTYSFQLDNGSYSTRKEFRYCEKYFY